MLLFLVYLRAYTIYIIYLCSIERISLFHLTMCMCIIYVMLCTMYGMYIYLFRKCWATSNDNSLGPYTSNMYIKLETWYFQFELPFYLCCLRVVYESKTLVWDNSRTNSLTISIHCNENNLKYLEPQYRFRDAHRYLWFFCRNPIESL